ncbi:I78 family peptidase inhibitor [Ottowia testudinis]|uniref:Proteinase inhibitor I78 n=1 Tax=Ottowia testudinis TaxID=2816950 RepID=A0A975H2L0_9BURK|nr:I78 family peptidase inhibitor [Ottowia testudinis]QTD44899.1 proteinase inhibitor I78 [Ottowia testudinis]
MRFTLISWPLACGPLLALAACSGSGAPAGNGTGAAPEPPTVRQVNSGQPPANRCDAQAAQSWVGQPFGPATLEQARAAAGADEARMLRPDSMITKEYKVGRLNVVVGADNRITRVHCG